MSGFPFYTGIFWIYNSVYRDRESYAMSYTYPDDL